MVLESEEKNLELEDDPELIELRKELSRLKKLESSQLGKKLTDFQMGECISKVQHKALLSVLELEKDASKHNVRQKYRNLSLKFHPDKLVEKSAKYKEVAIEVFKIIKTAYSILQNSTLEEEIYYLFDAIHRRKLRETEKLLEKLESLDLLDSYGETILFLIVKNCCIRGYSEGKDSGAMDKWIGLLEQVLSKNSPTQNYVDINAAGKSGTPLGYACSNKSGIKAMKVLLKFKADPNAPDQQGYTPLWYASNRGARETDIIKELFNHGAKIDTVYNSMSNNGYPVDKLKIFLPYITDKGKFTFILDILNSEKTSRSKALELLLETCPSEKLLYEILESNKNKEFQEIINKYKERFDHKNVYETHEKIPEEAEGSENEEYTIRKDHGYKSSTQQAMAGESSDSRSTNPKNPEEASSEAKDQLQHDQVDNDQKFVEETNQATQLPNTHRNTGTQSVKKEEKKINELHNQIHELNEELISKEDDPYYEKPSGMKIVNSEGNTQLEDLLSQSQKKGFRTLENEDQKVAPPDVEQVYESDEDKIFDAQDSNNKEDTGKSKIFESEQAQSLEKIVEPSQELNSEAAKVDTLTREIENTSRKWDNANKRVSELEQERSSQQIEINKLKDQITQLTEELKGEKAQLADLQKKLDDAKQLKEQLNSAQQDLAERTNKVNMLTKELDEIKVQFEENKRKLNIANKNGSQLNQQTKIDNLAAKVNKLTGEERKLKQELGKKAQELKSAKDQFVGKEKEINELKGQITQLTEELKGKKAQLADLQKKLDDMKQLEEQLNSTNESKIQDLWKQLESKNRLEEKLNSVQKKLDDKAKESNKLEQEKESAKQDLISKISEVDQLTGENNKLNDTVRKLGIQLTEKEQALDVANGHVSQLKQEKSTQQIKIDDLTLKNNRLTKEKDLSLDNENRKLSEASTQSRKQGNYATTSFILSGIFAVGTSLTTPYLTVCIALAVAASISLIVGGCCLYKANTALSDVKADKIANGPAVA